MRHFAAGVALLLTIFRVSSGADNLGVIGSSPKWNVLEKYQETITHDDFAHLLNDVYCTHGISDGLIQIGSESARILENRDTQTFFALRFAPDKNSCNPIPRLWHPAKLLPPAKHAKPLSNLRIALDPGHLGGEWAKMEERWFQVGDSAPVERMVNAEIELFALVELVVP